MSRSIVSDSLRSRGLYPARLLCPWDSPDKSTAVGCQSFLQGIFLTQGLNPVRLHCRQILYRLSHQAAHWFPDQGSNPRPLQWKCRFLTTGPPGKSNVGCFRASCQMLNIITSIQINSVRSRRCCSDLFISTSK